MIKRLFLSIKHYLNKYWEICERYANADNVLIYQMGKVGSSSLEQRIPGSIHFHSLYGKSPCYVHMEQNKATLQGYFRITLGDFLKRWSIKKRKSIKIITLTRDPYKRNISMFFQDVHYWMYAHIGDHRADTREEGDQILMDAFEQSYDHFYFDTWFDEELMRFTGVDVFNQPFPHQEAYQIIQQGKVEVFVTKMENLNSPQVLKAIEAFTDKKLEVANANTGDKKWYAPLYQSFKQYYKPEPAYLLKLKNSKVSRHFYP